MGLFQTSILKNYIKGSEETISAAYQKHKEFFGNPEIQKNIRSIKEESFQEGFLNELFVKVLGYTLEPLPNYNLKSEQKNENDNKKADGAILVDDEVRAVIELKDTKTNYLRDIEAQAFKYKNNNRKAAYVVTSNFEKLRFYIENAIDFVEFNLFTITEDEFSLLWICLAYENIAKDLPKQLKSESTNNEEKITIQLYKDYSAFKQAMFENIQKNNPSFDKLALFRKTQKLLDRFLFILFGEDKGLLPPNSMEGTIKKWKLRNEDPLNEYQSLYDRFKLYFYWLDIGRPEIFGYNGGLFKPDEILNAIIIDDDVLKESILKLSVYDFDTEIDVNILGHIFEHSLAEIEEIANEITTGEKQISKRKKDGVFYTPRYITSYIVENTLGKLCAAKKAEFEIDESEYFLDKNRQKSIKLKLDQKLIEYRKWLLSLTICDPACGSGAFLNSALDFLMNEHKNIDALRNKIYFGEYQLYDNIENEILENNLYGVDINDESVEIAKLALWLRTAKPKRKLNSLDNNIKCGNSLISNTEIAGEKAFDWHKEFPQVFEKGGFDVVIGNPPYVDIKQLDNEIVKYIFENYSTAENRINLYSIFIERGYDLLKNNGLLSFINPNSMLMNSSYQKLRDLLIDDLTEIIKLPDNVFEDATVETIIFIVHKNSNRENINALVYQKNDEITYIEKDKAEIIDKSQWKSFDSLTFNIYASQKQIEILNKIKGNNSLLGEIADFSLGITPYDKYKGHSEETIKKREFHAEKQIDSSYKPLIAGENIIRYGISDTIKEYLRYGDWLGAPREERFFTMPRIIVRQIVSGTPARIYAGYTDKSLYFTQIGFAIIPQHEINPKYLLTLINSKLLNFFHTYSFLDLEKELFQKILIANCKCFPIPTLSLEQQQPFIDLADKMLSLNSKLHTNRQQFINLLSNNFSNLKITGVIESFNKLDFKQLIAELAKQKIAIPLKEQKEWEEQFNENKQTCCTLEEQITETDREIDRMVYELYGITEEEVMVIEK